MSSNPRQIARGVMFLRTMMANVYLIREGASWVLVDTGFRGYADTIRSVAREFVGSIVPPTAIVLTHGHFDHVGSLPASIRRRLKAFTRLSRSSTSSRTLATRLHAAT